MNPSNRVKPGEDAIIITQDGGMVGIWNASEEDIILHADAIHEMMIDVMKDE